VHLSWTMTDRPDTFRKETTLRTHLTFLQDCKLLGKHHSHFHVVSWCTFTGIYIYIFIYAWAQFCEVEIVAAIVPFGFALVRLLM
jgi:hypothetical protein